MFGFLKKSNSECKTCNKSCEELIKERKKEARRLGLAEKGKFIAKHLRGDNDDRIEHAGTRHSQFFNYEGDNFKISHERHCTTYNSTRTTKIRYNGETVFESRAGRHIGDGDIKKYVRNEEWVSKFLDLHKEAKEQAIQEKKEKKKKRLERDWGIEAGKDCNLDIGGEDL